MREIVVTETWRDRLEALAGRRRDLVVVVGAVALLVVGGLALWARGRPAEIAPPAVSPVSSATVAPEGVMVHVAGKVKNPGLYELPMGSRVADAIAAAGGTARRANLDALNLADVVADGMKVLVPARGQAASDVPLPSAAPAKISLNSADQTQLESIPGIGPVTAAAILEYRTRVGSFGSIDELLEVTGIGPATLEAMRPYVTL